MDEIDQRSERIRGWLFSRLKEAANWSSDAAKKMTKAGAEETAYHLRVAAKNLREGHREKGIQHLEVAGKAAKSEGQRSASAAIAQEVKKVASTTSDDFEGSPF